jgi:hypothetical protein
MTPKRQIQDSTLKSNLIAEPIQDSTLNLIGEEGQTFSTLVADVTNRSRGGGGVPHHITQRGNGRQVVFKTDQDRFLYLDLLRKYAKQYGLRVWAWCLMSNHIHFLAVPERADSLRRSLAKTHSDYAH